MKPKVLIVDDMHVSITSLLIDAGFEPDYKPDIPAKDVYGIISKYDGIIVRSKLKINRELIDEAKSLKFVARAGAGVDNVDDQYLKEKGIALVNAPEGNRDALAEHTVGMLLSLFNKINTSCREVRSGIWLREENRGWELMGKTVGIFGYGFMGEAFARRLSGFSCHVIAYDKYKSIDSDLAKQVDLQTFMQQTEVLSIHVPLTAETRFLFDESYLMQFENLKFLVNTSRGEVLRLSAVNTLLDKGGLVGVALDVLENEKLHTLSSEQQKEFDALVMRPNVILTPHVAGWTFESYRKINEVLVRKLAAGGFAENG